MRSNPISLRSRLTTAVLATVGVVLVVLAVLLYLVVRRTAWRQHDDGLRARAEAIAAIAEHDDDGYEMSLPPQPAGQLPAFVEVWTRDGSVLARTPSLGTKDLPKLDGPLGAELADTTLPDGRAGRLIALRFVPRDDARTHPVEPMLLVLAEGTEAIDDAIATAGVWFIVLGLGALAAVFGVTTWSLRRGLRPLTELADRIEQIDDRRLTTRLSTAGQPAELIVPIRKLDELLARLERAFARERQFTADVSHELRTPLAGLRTLLEVTALRPRSTTEYADAMARGLEVVAQLGALVESLLALARLDADQPALETEPVRLHDLVRECWSPYRELATSRTLRFTNDVPEHATATTDREKLRIVVTNLLANAAEYTEVGGWIAVAQLPDGGLEVADSGPPIPDDQVDRVFDRLWRGDAARTATGVHCGIGLALARAMCDRLALSLTATSTTERVAFRIAPRGDR